MAQHRESTPSMDTESCTEEEMDLFLTDVTTDDGCFRRRGTKLAVYLLVGSCILVVLTYIVSPSAFVSAAHSRRKPSSTDLTQSKQVSVHSYQLSATNTTNKDPEMSAEWGQLISLVDSGGAQGQAVTAGSIVTATGQDTEAARTSSTTPASAAASTEPWTWTSTQTTSTVTETPPWAPAPSSPSLYCWEYVFDASEVALAKAQLLYHASIFQCNEFDVFSLEKQLLGGGPDGEVHTTIVPGPGAVPKYVSREGAPAVRVIVNQPLFARIWDRINKLGRFYDVDWVVKVDADAVFLPERLRPHLAWKNINRDALVWFKNCEAASWTTLQGPLEVFSHGAIDSFFANRWKCSVDESTNGAEDWFMAHCLESNGVTGTLDTELLNDNYCNNAIKICDCSWGERSAYHPCKDVPSYLACRNVAMGS